MQTTAKGRYHGWTTNQGGSVLKVMREVERYTGRVILPFQPGTTGSLRCHPLEFPAGNVVPFLKGVRRHCLGNKLEEGPGVLISPH